MIITDPGFDVATVAGGERIELDARLLASLAENRAAALDALTASGRPVYGVNTGMGRLATVVLDERQQAEHQRNLLVGRAVGGPPWLDAREVRLLLAVRLRDLLRPEAGASPELVRFLADRLNDRFTPAVPRGGLGSAGEIIALSHAFQTFLGIGTVLEDGVETSASGALERRGAEPYELGPKEGASLIQGSPLAVTHGLLGVDNARRLLRLQLLTAGIAVDALGAPRSAYLPETAGGDAYLRTTLSEILRLTEGMTERDGFVQAPVSVRVAPRALAHAARVTDELADALSRTQESVADSPAFVSGGFVSTACFHAVDLGLRMDAVTAALVHLGEIGVQRLHRMLDERFTGLPAQLAVDPGPQAGLTPLHKRAAGELHALRGLAAPATLGSIDTSSGQEDVQAFAWAAGDQLRAAAEGLFAITACELVGGAQARFVRGGDAPPALRGMYDWIASIVPPVHADRPLGPEVRALVAACRTVELR